MFILFLIFNLVSAFHLQHLYGGGCGIIGNVLYYMGGIGITQKNQGILSKEIYYINLKNGVEIKDNKPPWKEDKEEGLTGFGVNVMADNKTKSLYMLGGKNTKIDESFRIFDVSNKRWLINPSASKTLYLNTANNFNSYYLSSFIKDTKKHDQYYHLGGLRFDEKTNKTEGKLSLSTYNVKSDTWDILNNSTNLLIHSQTSQYYDNKIYILGGMVVNSNKIIDMNRILVFDTLSLKWYNQTISGNSPNPRFGLSSILIGSKMVILGGSESLEIDKAPKEDIYILELKEKELKWRSHKVEGFKSSFLGCLTKYNNYLIYSFGFHKNSTVHTQFINIDDWKLVNEIEAKASKNNTNISKSKPIINEKDKEGAGASTETNTNNLGGVIGGSLTGVILFIAIGITIFYLAKKKKKQSFTTVLNYNYQTTLSSTLKPVEAPLSAFDFDQIHDQEFSLTHDTSIPNLDDDLYIRFDDSPQYPKI